MIQITLQLEVLHVALCRIETQSTLLYASHEIRNQSTLPLRNQSTTHRSKPGKQTTGYEESRVSSPEVQRN